MQGGEMPKEVGIDEIRGLIEVGAQVVDVLPEAEYEEEHVAGAINIPLKQMTGDAVSVLDPDRPVIVYCHDYQ
jgi:rhodanese-related sulfurtransferase